MVTGMTEVVGYLKGVRIASGCGDVVAEVVQVDRELRPSGPAENAFVLVERDHGRPRGHYIAWINYHDIEDAIEKEPQSWRLIEPPERYTADVEWLPYGWEGSRSVPTIGFPLGS